MSLGRPTLLQVPAFVVLLTGLALSLFHGGYAPDVWHAAALFVLAVGVVAVVAAGVARRDRIGGFGVVLALFGAYVAWSYLSMLWAAAPGDAWEGANRTLLYWLVLAVVGLRGWTPGQLRAALGVVAAATTTIAAGELIALSGSEPGHLFLQGRLNTPLGYPNATSSLWLIGGFCAVHLAVDPAVRWWLRGACLGAAALLLQTAVLSQSRGAVLAFAVAALASVALSPRRWPTIAGLAAVIGATALSFGALTDVRNAKTLPALIAAVTDARDRIVVAAIVVTAVTTLVVLLARRALPGGVGPRVVRGADRALAALAGAVVLAGVVLLATHSGWVDARWKDFRDSGYHQVERGDNRLGGSLGSGRYDYYRVSLDAFARRPLLGLGEGNFQADYLRHRHTDETPRYPHSLLFRALGMTGLPGALLLFGALLGALALAVRGRAPARGGVAAAGAASAAVAWLAHAMVDWLWAFPALTMTAMALLAMAARATGGEGDPGAVAERAWPRGTRLAAGLVAVAMFASLAALGAAARFSEAARSADADPAVVVERLDRAADLNPLSSRELVQKAVYVRRRGDEPAAVRALTEALDRVPDDWFARFELGVLLTHTGSWSLADAELARARQLNPREPLIALAVRLANRRKRLSAGYFERKFSEPLTFKLSVTGG